MYNVKDIKFTKQKPMGHGSHRSPEKLTIPSSKQVSSKAMILPACWLKREKYNKKDHYLHFENGMVLYLKKNLNPCYPRMLFKNID